MTASSDYLRQLEDFRRYLATLTNKQVWGVYDKERAAHRSDETALTYAELRARGLIQSR
jgi:hypothetical protein